MWKVQLFVFVETVLLSMALVTMLAADFSRVVIILVLFLLLLYYYFGKQKGNFLLVASMIMLFFIIMLNPYVIAALLFALVYGMIVAYPYIYKENQETHLVYEEDVEIQLQINTLYGELNFLHHPSRKLRNETISLTTPDYKRANKTVKIVLVSFLGNVEVVRK